MSGRLVGLVVDHGPEDRSAWAVLMVVAERLHGPMRSYDATTDELARLARLSPATAKRAVALLVAEGWVRRVPGKWKGNASSYWLDLNAFPAEAVEKVLSKGVMVTPSPETKEGHGDPLTEPKGVMVTPKGVMVTQHSVPVTTPSLPDDSHQTSLLLPLTGGGGTDDYANTVLADVPTEARPRDHTGLASVLQVARDAGWQADALARALAAERHDYQRIRGGAVLASLRALVRRPAPSPAWQPCGQCVNGWLEDPKTGMPVTKCSCHPTYDGSKNGVAFGDAATKNGMTETRNTVAELQERFAKRFPNNGGEHGEPT